MLASIDPTAQLILCIALQCLLACQGRGCEASGCQLPRADTDSLRLIVPNQVLLARFTPLGSSACPLFARKFGAPALGSVQEAAAEYLSGRRRAQ